MFPELTRQRTVKESQGEGFPKTVAFLETGSFIAQGTERGVVQISSLSEAKVLFDLRHCSGD